MNPYLVEKAYSFIRNMFIDRGYPPKSFEQKDKNHLFAKTDRGESVLVYFADTDSLDIQIEQDEFQVIQSWKRSRFKVKDMRSLLKTCESNKIQHAIIVSNEITSAVQKEHSDHSIHWQFFSYWETAIDRFIHHELFPYLIERVTSPSLLKQLDIHRLPKYFKSDPMIKYWGLLEKEVFVMYNYNIQTGVDMEYGVVISE